MLLSSSESALPLRQINAFPRVRLTVSRHRHRNGSRYGTFVQRNPEYRLLWMLIFVPIVLLAEAAVPHSYTLLFVLAVLAIVPLAALLSHATEAVAAETGDAVGGLLNATLGNLTELIIAITALHAGQYMLVKASIAGAIVTNAVFMLGACLLIGGMRYHVQEYNRAGAQLSSGLLLLATVALLAPSAVADLEHLPQRWGRHEQAQRRHFSPAHCRLRARPVVLSQDA